MRHLNSNGSQVNIWEKNTENFFYISIRFFKTSWTAAVKPKLWFSKKKRKSFTFIIFKSCIRNMSNKIRNLWKELLFWGFKILDKERAHDVNSGELITRWFSSVCALCNQCDLHQQRSSIAHRRVSKHLKEERETRHGTIDQKTRATSPKINFLGKASPPPLAGCWRCAHR